MTDEEAKTKVEALLQWPPATWTRQEHRLVCERRSHVQAQMSRLVDSAERFDRDLTADEAEQFERMRDEYDRLTAGSVPAAD